jgi:hypothetical protein
MKTCKCGTEFVQYTSFQKKCHKCLVEDGREKQKKHDKREIREKKKKLKTKSEWEADCQKAVNRYIRARDFHEPCISCGTTRQDIQYAAGHYLTRGGHPELRYHEDNIHKQCNKRCNLELSGNIAAYRINLIKKIGIERVEFLEGPHEPRKDTVEDLQERIKKYNKMALELEKNLR